MWRPSLHFEAISVKVRFQSVMDPNGWRVSNTAQWDEYVERDKIKSLQKYCGVFDWYHLLTFFSSIASVCMIKFILLGTVLFWHLNYPSLLNWVFWHYFRSLNSSAQVLTPSCRCVAASGNVIVILSGWNKMVWGELAILAPSKYENIKFAQFTTKTIDTKDRPSI